MKNLEFHICENVFHKVVFTYSGHVRANPKHTKIFSFGSTKVLKKEIRPMKSHQRRISHAMDRLEDTNEDSVYNKLTSLRKSYKAQADKLGKREVLKLERK